MTHPSAPSIEDLLTDSLIQKVMQADRVEPQALRALMNGAAGRLAGRRRGASVTVGQDLGRRAPLREPLLLARPATRMTAGARDAAICG
jgi:hypothetical protein